MAAEKKKDEVTEADLKFAINQVVIEFLQEKKDEIVRRAHSLLRKSFGEKKKDA